MTLLTTTPDMCQYVDWGLHRGWYFQFGAVVIGGVIGAVYLYENAEPYYIQFRVTKELDNRKGSPGYGKYYTAYWADEKRALTDEECEHFVKLLEAS